MMYVPSIYNMTRDLFDDMLDFEWPAFSNGNGKSSAQMMKTDVKETENGYELSMDLPGYRKEDISAELKKGYLTVSAARNTENEEKDKNGKYIRKERFQGNVTRSFYVGEDLSEDMINARFENGILTLDIPKTEPKKELEEKHQILIG